MSKEGNFFILITTEGSGDFDIDTPITVNPLQLLNTIHIDAPVQREFMRVQVLVNGVLVKAMMDSGVTHNFVASQEAKNLGLELV